MTTYQSENAKGERIHYEGKLLTDKQVERLKRTGYPYVKPKGSKFDSLHSMLYGNGYMVYQKQEEKLQRVKGSITIRNGHYVSVPRYKTVSNTYPMKYDEVEKRWKKVNHKCSATLIPYIEQAIETQNQLALNDPGRQYEIRRADGSCIVNAITTSINMAYLNLLNNSVVKNA